MLLTSGNALLFLTLCVFLISSPPPPAPFRNFQKLLEMVLFSASLGNGISSGTNPVTLEPSCQEVAHQQAPQRNHPEITKPIPITRYQ